ncbi:hypothetical protein QQG09_06470 [Melissococcus plutonius]|uniref:hypothetical protein n=1 Tax=Melissococcus plutonius TaxID=33970 RepID=UPI0021E5CF5D|nr:hypothetical protein [Melissococcus plutonius]MCV2499614.1 hypothetical protein [Melissococcus plutonius]MCV2501534.1 hypothetical protein [Melissococcus plutonius]MCV2505965.1 hypothetical protein [Melissococcus plutonius]MCV2508206.1 hypothetical protein [Melissococcus plutonius]MCV2520006.1 hypothetical protein [Melissococcus plutonius]
MKQLFIPIDLQSVFNRIENEELDNLFYETTSFGKTMLCQLGDKQLKLNELKYVQFYTKTSYTPIEEQRVGEE